MTIQETDYGKLKARRNINSVDAELRFTEVYKATSRLHPFLRELECLKVQTQEILKPLQKGAWFAGRLERLFVGIDPERGDLNEVAYFCQFTLLKEQLQNPDLPESVAKDIQSLIDFWSEESTFFRCREAFPEHIKKGLPSDDYYLGYEIAYPMFGLGGPCLDYDKLLQLGLSGLKSEILNKLERKDPKANSVFLEACIKALEIVSETAIRYADEAKSKSTIENDAKEKTKLEEISNSLIHITDRKPQTLHQAIQLFWLYNLISLSKNYGRMDVFLGDFLENDLKTGRLSWEQAREMLYGLWNQIADRGDNFNNRIIIGGRGRRNEANADLFAILTLEVQALRNQSIPQLSVRWYNTMPQEIWDKSLDVIGLGSTFPILYNDDVNIAAVAKGLDISISEAEQYVPYGCGEYVIDHASLGSPDAALNIVKALDVTLFNGIDSFTGLKKGLPLGQTFETFDEFKVAFARQIDYQVTMLSDAQDRIMRVTAKYIAYPLLSILYDDCIQRGQPLLSGGVRYLGGTLESFGNNTAGDALYAIKRLVFDKKLVPLERLKEALYNNFAGNEKLRQRLLRVDKYGNDLTGADEMSVWVNEMVCESARRQKHFTGLHSFSVVLVNNGDNVTLGKGTGASADGRLKGEPLSNGNQPGAGYDKQGITALLNSMTKLDPSLHAGATHNLKFSRKLFQKEITKISALLKAYFAKGGTQAMITVTDVQELENALKEPEKYGNLIVRVGGYSERFIDLPHDVQLEVMKRTLY
jgi:pyruvate-formate lyase